MSSEDRARDAEGLLQLLEAKKLRPEVVRRWLTADWGGVEADGGGAGAP